MREGNESGKHRSTLRVGIYSLPKKGNKQFFACVYRIHHSCEILVNIK